ncbi:ADP-ribose glycohydrolase MACROD1 isoform X3 [Petromyzon marinus]|uniref:ADP-ribose glycohydrolase MACROD1 isoform X3 n=1 Tax=Petromyzon marinus TaxID=7757 RepID=UPI003F715BA3
MIANLLGALSVRRVPCLRSTPGPGPRRLLLLLLPPQLHRSGGYSSSSSYSSSRSSYSSSYSYSSSSNADESCNSGGKGSYSSSSKSYSSRGNATDNSGRYNSYSSSNNNNSSNSDSSSSGSLYDNGSCDISNSSRSRSSSSSRFGGGGGGGTDINSSSSNSCSSGSGSDGRIRISSSSSSSSSRRSGVRKQSGGGGVSLARKGGGGGAAESPSAPKQESLCRRQPSSSMAANQSKIDWNSWEKAKDQLTKLKDMDERRKYYKCSSNYITLKSLDKWSEKDLHSQDLHSQDKLTELEKPETCASTVGGREYEVNHQINDKVSLFKGDITLLEIDAIVNAANSTLLGGGGVDGCIHRSAGSLLKEECRSLGGCSTGKAKITCGYRLPSKYVIHTVGPRVMDSVPTPEERKQLDGCYSECLHIVEDKELRSVAFPCISTGIYGFPNEPAARIALETTRNWLEKYHSKVDRIIFCLFLPIDVELYDTLMPVYFPRAPKESSEGVADGPAVAGTENESDDKDRDPKDVEEDEAKDEDMPSQDTDSDPTKTSAPKCVSKI